MTTYRPENPLIVQGDHTVLVEVASPRYAEARDRLVALRGAGEEPRARPHLPHHAALDLERLRRRRPSRRDRRTRSPSTPSTRCPARAQRRSATSPSATAGCGCGRGERRAGAHADEPAAGRGGRARSRGVAPLLGERAVADRVPRARGASAGGSSRRSSRSAGPAEDLAGYTAGEPLAIALRDTTPRGRAVRPARLPGGGGRAPSTPAGAERGGSGVIVLPCGAGKTIVGMAAWRDVGSCAR